MIGAKLIHDVDDGLCGLPGMSGFAGSLPMMRLSSDGCGFTQKTPSFRGWRPSPVGWRLLEGGHHVRSFLSGSAGLKSLSLSEWTKVETRSSYGSYISCFKGKQGILGPTLDIKCASENKFLPPSRTMARRHHERNGNDGHGYMCWRESTDTRPASSSLLKHDRASCPSHGRARRGRVVEGVSPISEILWSMNGLILTYNIFM